MKACQVACQVGLGSMIGKGDDWRMGWLEKGIVFCRTQLMFPRPAESSETHTVGKRAQSLSGFEKMRFDPL